MDFTTEDSVRKFLNKTALTDQESEVVSMLIPFIGGVIRNYCGWNILADDYIDKKFSGLGGSTLDLKVFPVNSVEKLEIGGVDYLSQVSINEEDGELYFESTAGMTFTAGTRNIVITFNAGYEEVPAELEHTAAWLCALFFNRIDLQNIGVKSERFNDTEVTYDPTDLPVLVKQVLDRYRRIGIY